MNPSQQIDHYLDSLEGWKSDLLAQLRALIHQADPEIVEEWKWGVPVFVHKTMVCAISDFKDHVKINFFKGARLTDPDKLFNNGFDSKQHRSIDFKEGDKINESATFDLIRAAIALNTSK